MNKEHASKAGIYNFIIVGFSLIVLWAGFISFTVVTFKSIGAETNSTYLSAISSPTKLNIELVESKLAYGRTQPTDTEQSLEIPITVINLLPAYQAEVDAIDSLSYFKLQR